MKTLAQLKRDAKAGTIALEMTEWFGNTGEQIPERLRGIRKVIGANTVSIFLQNEAGTKSTLDIDSANLIEYSDKELIVYKRGLRELTEEEQKCRDEVKAIYTKYTEPWQEPYWEVKAYYAKCPCPWMSGMELIRGKKYDYNTGKVYDNAVKGDAIIHYIVHAV